MSRKGTTFSWLYFANADDSSFNDTDNNSSLNIWCCLHHSYEHGNLLNTLCSYINTWVVRMEWNRTNWGVH